MLHPGDLVDVVGFVVEHHHRTGKRPVVTAYHPETEFFVHADKLCLVAEHIQENRVHIPAADIEVGEHHETEGNDGSPLFPDYRETIDLGVGFSVQIRRNIEIFLNRDLTFQGAQMKRGGSHRLHAFIGENMESVFVLAPADGLLEIAFFPHEDFTLK
jgi:hypothetical protein